MKFMDAFGTGLGGTLGNAVGNLLPVSTNTNTNTEASGTSKQVQQRKLSQEAINKLIYDAMSADSGVAALATGENLAGSYGATARAQLTQDFMVKLIGELAAVTAPVETTGETQQSSTNNTKTKKKVTVICTELNRQGLLSDDLYLHPTALKHFLELPEETIYGYQVWADSVAEWMKFSKFLSKFFLPIAVARYRMIISGDWNLVGWLTIGPGQWICNKIGKLVGSKETDYGYTT